jgi:threonine aldolase
MRIIDLRSDTVTRPSEPMLRAMFDAPVGDDVFGDDPSVNLLQETIARLLGFEAALFCPSGTQSNLCGILSHCQRGEEYIVGQMAHTYRWEAGGAAVLGSVQPQPLAQNPDGTIDLDDIAAAVKPDDPHYAVTRLLALENTWGGHLVPHQYLQGATDLARRMGLATHLDGARLFNAAVAQAAETGNSPRQEARKIASFFDSVSVCFSKGLGAPVGSALCGSRDLIAKARRIRKMAGGGMRQAGFLAAAAAFALEHNITRLADDHANATRLAEGLVNIPGLTVTRPQTNIVFVDIEPSRQKQTENLTPFLRERGILITGQHHLRFVTHMDIHAEDVATTILALQEFFQKH